MKCKITGNIKSKDQIAWKFFANKRGMLTYFRLLPNHNSHSQGFSVKIFKFKLVVVDV